jgi:hypothetical protein
MEREEEGSCCIGEESEGGGEEEITRNRNVALQLCHGSKFCGGRR